MSSVPLHPPAPARSYSGPPPLPPAQLAFSGNRDDFFRLAARGALLELVTVGFYRFWLTTDIRRHMWSNTLIDGDAVEYTGRGKELLIGFLFALAILVPIYLGYFLITIEVERLKGFASIPLLIAFYAFGQFAIYRARRYRLTRTVWRGVRFWMDGSGWAYAWRALLWGLLVVLTLGIALPWREAALERYKMSHSYYGDLQGSFEGRGWEFFKRGWWLWLLTPLALYLSGLAFNFFKDWEFLKRASWLLSLAPLLYFTIALPFIYAAFKAVEWRWWLSGLRFGGVQIQSKMTRGALIGLYWKVIGWFFLLFILLLSYWGLCAVLVASMKGMHASDFVGAQAFAKNVQVFARSVPFQLLVGIGYVALVLAANVMMRIYLMRDLWAKVFSTATIRGIEAAANVAAKGELAGALGEGFADGLDVAGF